MGYIRRVESVSCAEMPPPHPSSLLAADEGLGCDRARVNTPCFIDNLRESLNIN